MMGFSIDSLDALDAFMGVVLLVITSGFVNSLLQYFKINICQSARLIQAGVLFLLSAVFGSSFGIVFSMIELVIGLADYLAETNSTFAWLDPNLA